MSEKEIWNYCVSKKAYLSRPFDRDLIWIKKEDFESLKTYFKKEFNIFHKEASLRSRGLLRHTHAIDQGDYVCVHTDTGNLARFFPLGLIHLFLDFIPYEVFLRIKGLSMEALLTRPE